MLLCFSAPASFAASLLLTAAGVVCLRMVRRPGQRAFAAIPLIFAVQQAIEGLLWLQLEGASGEAQALVLSRSYLVFAQLLWPVWVPFAIRSMERDPKRRSWLAWSQGSGLVAAAYLGWSLFSAPPVATIAHHHIHYTLHYPWHLEHPGSVLYFLATVVPCFLSGQRRMWVLGLVLLLSYLVARFLFPGNVISVWCYFAALISASILFLLHGYRSGFRAEQRNA